jgi:hypothetical protein
MKLTDNQYFVTTPTLVGAILLVADIWGPLNSWWAILYVSLLINGWVMEWRTRSNWKKHT